MKFLTVRLITALIVCCMIISAFASCSSLHDSTGKTDGAGQSAEESNDTAENGTTEKTNQNDSTGGGSSSGEATQPGSSEESSADEYTLISTISQLQSISSNGKYCLTADIDLGGAEWTPIGTDPNPFAGVFDGNGHTISNFKITQSKKFAGLFGLSVGEIKNLGVKDFTIDISSESETNLSAGGLVAYNNYNGVVTNCYAIGKVNVTSTTSSSHVVVGGLVGTSNGTMTDCYATCGVSATADSSQSFTYVGGLVGDNFDGTITNCHATGNVSASSDNNAWVGGLVGRNYNVIKNCYATGNVSADSDGVATPGGLIGDNSGTVTYCYASGEINANGSFSSAGGLTGNSGGSLTNCYATGNVGVTAERYYYLGVLIGKKYGTVTNCYSYSGQKITETLGENSSDSITNTDDTAMDIHNFYSKEWHQNTLGWTDIDAWNFKGVTYPTLIQ